MTRSQKCVRFGMVQFPLLTKYHVTRMLEELCCIGSCAAPKNIGHHALVRRKVGIRQALVLGSNIAES